MKNVLKKLSVLLMLMLMLAAFAVTAFADEAPVAAEAADTVASETAETEDTTVSSKAYAAAVTIAVVAAAGAVSMGLAISKSVEGIARQPEAEGKIRTSLMLGLVFVETAIIYALIIAILIIFVL